MLLFFEESCAFVSNGRIAVATGGNSKFEKRGVYYTKITMDLEFYCYNSNLKTMITQKKECLLLQSPFSLIITL